MVSKGERAIYQHHESLLAMGISFFSFFFFFFSPGCAIEMTGEQMLYSSLLLPCVSRGCPVPVVLWGCL